MFSFSDVLKKAWNIYTTYFGTFFLLFAVMVLPLYLTMDYIPDYDGVAFNDVSNTPNAEVVVDYKSNIDIIAAALDVQTSYLWAEIGLQIVLGFITFGISLMIIQIVAVVWNNKKIELHAVREKITPLYLPALVTVVGFFIVFSLLLSIPYVIAVLLNGSDSSFLFITLAVIAILLWSTPYLLFIPHNIILAEKKYIAAIKGSYEIVQGNWWKIMFQYLGILLFFIPLAGILGLITLPITSSGIFGTEALLYFVIDILAIFVTIVVVVQFLYLQEEQKVAEAISSTTEDDSVETTKNEEQENEEE